MYRLNKSVKFLLLVPCTVFIIWGIHYAFEKSMDAVIAELRAEFRENAMETNTIAGEDNTGCNGFSANNDSTIEALSVLTKDEDNNSNSVFSYVISDVPHLYQMENYPTGCESVAAVSLMKYYGIDISVDAFIDYYLDTAGTPYYEAGILKGESPWNYFIGDPRTEYGFGCYATVIKKAMDRCLPEEFCTLYIENKSLYDISNEYVSKGIPVMIWATMEMKEPVNGDSWELSDGTIFTFIRPEHALLLIGFDNEKYYFSDSMSKDTVVSYPKACCERAFGGLGNQALVIVPKD